MIDFLTLKPETFGLDISDLSLKIVKLKKRGGSLSLASWGEMKIKQGIIKEGEIKDEAALAEIIKEAVGKAEGESLKTKYLVASLPEKNAFLQVIQMPKMSGEELKAAIPFEAENYIPLPINEVYLDFQVVPPAHNHLDYLDVLISALPRKTTDPYVSSLKKAGLVAQALEIESQSISRALIKNGLSPFPILIVDFGRSRTTLIIFSGYSLRFTSTIPISSGGLTEAIYRNLKVDLAEAEKLKLKYGIRLSKKRGKSEPKRKVSQKKIFEAAFPLLTDLAEQIKKYLAYYQTHAKQERLSPGGKKVEKVLLCGRGAVLKGFDDFLSGALKIPVELGNPWVNILPEPLKEVPQLSFKESLGYTTALGLALRKDD